MAVPDSVELAKWERGELRRHKLVRVVLGVWHNYIPKLFGWTLSPIRLIFGVIRGLIFFGFGLSPIWMKFLDGNNSLTWSQAISLSVVYGVLLAFCLIYDKFVRDNQPKKRQRIRTRLSLELCGVTAALVGRLKLTRKECQPEIDALQSKVLQCVRDAARAYLGDHEGAYLEATLLLFDDKDCQNMKVAMRTTHSRPAGRVVPSAEIMAYYVAKSRKHLAINDFVCDPHPFPKTDLSGDKPVYRSILFVPLLDIALEGRDTCVGMVSVDSGLPYHFWPRNGDDVVVHLQPYCSLLTFLLTLGEPNRLTRDS